MKTKKRILILGVGSFAHSMMGILSDAGAETACYLTREYGHYGPESSGLTWTKKTVPSPIPCINEFHPDLIIPMSIDWITKPWSGELIKLNIPILCPQGDAIQLEVQRSLAETLCRQCGINVPISYFARKKQDAKEIIKDDPRAYVIKNPVCSPFSPIHTIVCESVEETEAWIELIDYSEGVFLQEFMGTAEAGHFVFVSDGQIYSLATNQEYKRAFTGNQGPVAGAPLGGIVEQDPHDKYGLAESLIKPLVPWFQKTKFQGPLQVTAVFRDGNWYPIEYNVRLGVTSGAIFLRMLDNPVESLLAVARNQKPDLVWKQDLKYGCSLTLAGYGYPYYIPSTPKLPITISSPVECDLWWNEVEHDGGQLYIIGHEELDQGHRIADIVALDEYLEPAIKKAYRNIQKINCLASYFRTDVGDSLWPPGTGFQSGR